MCFPLTCGGDDGEHFLQGGQKGRRLRLPDALQQRADAVHLGHILSQLLLLVGCTLEVAHGAHQLLAEQCPLALLAWHTLWEVGEQHSQTGTERRRGTLTDNTQDFGLERRRHLQHSRTADEQTQAAVEEVEQYRVAPVQGAVALLKEAKDEVFADKVCKLVAVVACVCLLHLSIREKNKSRLSLPYTKMVHEQRLTEASHLPHILPRKTMMGLMAFHLPSYGTLL